MGLNAVVYRSAENLPSEIRSLPIQTDPDTGEISSVSGDKHLEPTLVIALDKRLGNVAMIDYLRNVLARQFNVPLLLSKVLQSGSHSGDIIPISQLPQLRNELELIRGRAELRHQEDILVFVQSLTELLDVAEKEQNPIVFV